MPEAALTPMMQQYQRIRRELAADTLLLFRLGDFYEMFFEDARNAAAILNVALTRRGQVPMCGVPYHAAEGYIAKLVKAGRRVAICDQIGEATPGKIVRREVTQIVSPGTISDLNLLDAKRNNYLAAIGLHKKQIGFAYLDTSTGEFEMTELPDAAALEDELARVRPSEILIGDGPQRQAIPLDLPSVVECDGYLFIPEQAEHTLCEHFAVQSLDGFGGTGMTAAIGAAGAIVHYLKHQMRRQIGHVTRLKVYRRSSSMIVDAASQANLELVESRGARDMSLLAALDRTLTPMGGRLLRHWVLHPLCETAPLLERQQTVALILEDPALLNAVRESLKGIRDIERGLGRLSQAGGNPRDLLALKNSLDQLPDLRARFSPLATPRPGEQPSLGPAIHAALREFPELSCELERALVDEPPIALKDGGIFRDGYHPQLDEWRAACRDGKQWIAALQQREIEATGIKSLKIKFTNVFGYFIEVTKANLASVPEHYIRKQTTVNSERFITPELKEMEGKILGAEERSKALEYELFGELRTRILHDSVALQETAGAIGLLDLLCSLAEVARLFNYIRPKLHDGLSITLRDGRHPVLDQSLAEEKFVPNDTELDGVNSRLQIITGPNMAGKSTYIRQVALIVLMAQIGSFVPAAAAEIGVVDRIFTRVGASDDLSRGQSTFMVEMNETANILNNATERSLVILDEIGRGTSTFDGLSIAWSVAEYLHDELKARTLFATHYHELTELELTRKGVKNYNVAVREWNDQIIFLRKIIPGGADKSYGIQVARLAGLPKRVISRAKEVLGNLEQSELNADGKPLIAEEPARLSAARRRAQNRENRPQLSLF
ncbi:MAG TPA: DNA mismatch repair protein MutS [Chthoniobacteraceae bacterium]|nr:DNA mismatch repair protein MutS [Chthoniobacteraceae bacterium]